MTGAALLRQNYIRIDLLYSTGDYFRYLQVCKEEQTIRATWLIGMYSELITMRQSLNSSSIRSFFPEAVYTGGHLTPYNPPLGICPTHIRTLFLVVAPVNKLLSSK
jgi:hypothetical protein